MFVDTVVSLAHHSPVSTEFSLQLADGIGAVLNRTAAPGSHYAALHKQLQARKMSSLGSAKGAFQIPPGPPI